MKKMILLVIFTASLHAIDYTSIINTIAQEEVNKFRSEFTTYNKKIATASAAIVSMSNIDFSPDHKGFSFGIGVATTRSDFGDGVAGAIGIQYGFSHGAINVKYSHNNSDEYILGSGIVIGF